MIIRIAIADKNPDYIERLSAVFQGYSDLLPDFFTSGEALETALENKNYNIVLFDPDISEDRLYFDEKILPVVLYREDAENLAYYASLKNIHKYQRVSGIYKEIMAEYAKVAKDLGIELSTGGRTQIIAVASPMGGSGKTAVSCILADAIRKSGHTVLHVSAEMFNTASAFFPKQDEGITALIRAVAETKDFKAQLSGTVNTNENGIMYVEGFDRMVDYDDVSSAEMEETLRKIGGTGLAEYVVVETSGIMDRVTQGVLAAADKILLTEVPGEIESMKMAAFMEQTDDETILKAAVIHNKKDSTSKSKNKYYAGQLKVVGEINNMGALALKDLVRYGGQNSRLDMDYILE